MDDCVSKCMLVIIFMILSVVYKGIDIITFHSMAFKYPTFQWFLQWAHWMFDQFTWKICMSAVKPLDMLLFIVSSCHITMFCRVISELSAPHNLLLPNEFIITKKKAKIFAIISFIWNWLFLFSSCLVRFIFVSLWHSHLSKRRKLFQ